ncbi:MAG: hypothetical protein FJ088_15585, partial [Deltaproteobacteria bacterium]|nr:hypothetical protein [Deltaproteobacteria bacterium]
MTETLNSLNLSVRAEVALALNFFIEGRFLYWAAAKEPENNAFLLLNGREPRAEFETELLEAYVSYKSPRFSIIAGNQIIGWGGTSFVNPVNQINPLDYRYGILTDEKLPYLPVPAVRIVKSFGIASVEAVFVPFFIPSRYSLAGRDYALFNGQAGAVQMPPVFTYAMGLLDQTVSYKVQPYFFATELPDEIPDNFSGGARIMFDFTDVKLGFSYFYGFDRTPYAVFNKDMALVLGKVFETGFDMAALLSLMADPDETEFRESYQKILDEKIPVEDVYRSSYKRMHSAGFEGSATFGDFNLNLEAAFQPERTFYYSDLTPFRKPCLSSAASLEYNHGTDFDLTLELSYLRLFDIEKGRDLLLIENDM